ALANGGAPIAGAAGMVPGGINPAYIQWAQQQANARSAFGVPVPGYMNEAGGLPFVGPQAAAKAEAENASKLRYAGPMAAAEAPYKMIPGRPGTIMWNGLGQPVGASPLMVESFGPEGNKTPA